MLFNEFIEETRKIERFYGKELSEEQQKIWFENLKKINIERYKYLIGEMYRKNKYFPTLAEIFQLNEAIGIKKPDEKTYKTIKCNICNGRGVIAYSKTIDYLSYNFVCKCNCANSSRYIGFPSLNDVGFSEEVILRARERNKSNMTPEQAKAIVKHFMKTGIFSKSF